MEIETNLDLQIFAKYISFYKQIINNEMSNAVWLDKLKDMFLTSLTLVPFLLLGVLAFPVVQSLYFLTPFFEETETEIGIP